MAILNIRLLISFLSIITYYHYFKILLRYPAYCLARLLQLTKTNTLEESKGAVGFILVIVSHVFFALILCFALDIKFQQLGFSFPGFKLILLGMFLGLGLAGTSMIICLLIVKLIAFFTQFTEEQVMLALPGGWLKSYEYIKVIAPPYIFMPAIVLQLTCEEIIFRGIFINYFINFGVLYTIITSTLLFALMQIFLIPTIRGALFPVIGALLMGMVHGYLFLVIDSLWPLVFSHMIFFMLFTA